MLRRRFFSPEQIERANSIEISSVMESFMEPYRRVGQYLEPLAHDSVRIQGNRYNWYSRGTYGKTINFVMEYFGYSFLAAVEAILREHFQAGTKLVENRDTGFFSQALQKAEWNPQNLLEVSDKRRAIAYLCRSRGIDYRIVVQLIATGMITQDSNGCILFKVINEEGKVVGAERRAMSERSKFRQTAHGTSVENGVNLILGTPRQGFFFESAIDLISFYELEQHNLQDCILVSMRGLKSGLIVCYKERYGMDYENIFICTDDDVAGERFRERVQASMPGAHSLPVGGGCKDWNEKLKEAKTDAKTDALHTG